MKGALVPTSRGNFRIDDTIFIITYMAICTWSGCCAEGVSCFAIVRLILQDPSVMSAALCALLEVTFRDPKPYKNVIPSFVSILKQVKAPLPEMNRLEGSICCVYRLHKASAAPVLPCCFLKELLIITRRQYAGFQFTPVQLHVWFSPQGLVIFAACE